MLSQNKKGKKSQASIVETASKEINDEILRLRADFDNYRKRVEKEKIDILKYSNQDLVVKLLPVVDNFERAINHFPKMADETINNWLNGISAIEKQLVNVLVEIGVSKIEVKKGDLFDPNLHEAVSHEKSDLPNNSIIEPIQSGYQFADRIIRPAKVRVSSGIDAS